MNSVRPTVGQIARVFGMPLEYSSVQKTEESSTSASGRRSVAVGQHSKGA
ncbi:hypothetical protein ACSS6W_009650 [Trichoderma asperelloides]